MSNKKLAQVWPERKLSAYALVITLSCNVRLRVGKLGLCRFDAGNYVYAGSAKRAFDARIRRHLSSEKRLHWHVDYLLASEYATVRKVWAFPETTTECGIIGALVTSGAVNVPVAGFGAGDCRNRCPAHLVRLSKKADGLFKRLGGQPYG